MIYCCRTCSTCRQAHAINTRAPLPSCRQLPVMCAFILSLCRVSQSFKDMLLQAGQCSGKSDRTIPAQVTTWQICPSAFPVPPSNHSYSHETHKGSFLRRRCEMGEWSLQAARWETNWGCVQRVVLPQRKSFTICTCSYQSDRCGA